MKPRPQIYNLREYILLVGALVARGYSITSLVGIAPQRPCLFLRHDIDMCLGRAVAMAEAEAATAFKATYYVLVRSEMYNVSSRACRNALQRISALGHDIGLHFDSAGLPVDLASWNVEAAADCKVLECAIGRPVTSISFHRPTEAMQGLAADINGKPHVYQPRYFKEIGYCSDSAGGFRYHHPLDHPSTLAGRSLQLLTHPIWWVDELGTPLDKLDRFLDGRIEILKQELATNCKVYRR
jgi:hypothetical protein